MQKIVIEQLFSTNNFDRIMETKIWTTNTKKNWIDADSAEFWHFALGEGLCSQVAKKFKSQGLLFSPEESDLLIISGFVNEKLLEVIKNIRSKMIKPNYCIALGNCSVCDNELFSLGVNIEHSLKIDFFVPGCPVDMNLFRQAIAELSQKINENIST